MPAVQALKAINDRCFYTTGIPWD